MSQEIIRIQKCPRCKGAHTYRLEVERTHCMRVITRRKKGEQPTAVRITSQLICPVRDEHYQESFYLKDTSADRIRAVSVLGLAATDQ